MVELYFLCKCISKESRSEKKEIYILEECHCLINWKTIDSK